MLLNCGVGEDSRSPVDCKEIQAFHPKGNQYWMFIGRTDAKAETPIPWPPDARNRVTREDPDVGKDWRQEEKGLTEDEMFGFHHWLDGHEFEYAPGVGVGQGRLVCCGPWGRKESYTTEWPNWTKILYIILKVWLWCSKLTQRQMKNRKSRNNSNSIWKFSIKEKQYLKSVG